MPIDLQSTSILETSTTLEKSTLEVASKPNGHFDIVQATTTTTTTTEEQIELVVDSTSLNSETVFVSATSVIETVQQPVNNEIASEQQDDADTEKIVDDQMDHQSEDTVSVDEQPETNVESSTIVEATESVELVQVRVLTNKLTF